MQIVSGDYRVQAIGRRDGAQAAAPLACLFEDAMAVRFHRWRGGSGARYTTTVYPIDRDDPMSGLPDLGPAILIAVTRHGGSHAIAGLVAIERDSDWAAAVARLHAGADEWHVHLLAQDRAARAAAVSDLRSSQRLASVA